MAYSAAEVDRLKQAPTTVGLLPAIAKRWSPRSFSTRAVTDNDLKRLFEAARWTASAYNEQPWRYLVGRQGDPTYKAIFESLIGFNQDWAGKAPVLILGVAETKFSHNGTANGYALYDLGAATSQLALEAAELGILLHQMAGFDRERARQLLGLPDSVEPAVAVALGYQGEPAALTNERLLEMETSPRARKPLSETVFSAWGKAAELS